MGVTIWLAMAVPLGLHFSQPTSDRSRLHRGFIWGLALVVGVITAYLIAALDANAFGQHSLWFVLGSTILLVILCIVQLLRALERHGLIARQEAEGTSLGHLPRSTVRLCSSSAEFAKVILEVESDADQIDRMVKRVSAVFKDPDAARDIAERRFGPGSRQASAYLHEHSERHRIFIDRLAREKLACREIYQEDELRRYAEGRQHGIGIVLDRQVVQRTVEGWLECVQTYDRYWVGLTDEPIPLKYQVFGGSRVVLHEAAGSMDGQRLNAIVIEGEEGVAGFQADFDQVWERIPAARRSKPAVVDFIENELLPLLR